MAWGFSNASEMKNPVMITGIPCTAGTGVFATSSKNYISAKHRPMYLRFANPKYITSSTISVSTSNGQVTISGTCTAGTTADIILVETD